MRIDVGELLRTATGESRTYDAAWEARAVADAVADRVTGAVTLVRTGAGVLVRANFDLLTTSSCSRCLQPVEVPLRIAFDEEFLPKTDPHTGARLPQPEDPGAFRITEDGVLDLGEAVLQYREMALPMQPLCRPDCAGLCPRCGADRNTGPCACAPEPADVRWSALADLKRRLVE